VIHRPSPADNIVEEDLDSDVCLYRTDTDEVLVLNSSAADVWRLSDGTLTVAEMIERLSVAYAVPAEALDGDVRGVLTDLTSRGYLAESGTSRAG
jgi:hypothetical protein